MTLNFPADPQLNDEYSFGTKTWAYNGFGWKLKTADDVIFSSTVRANSEFFIANGAVSSFTLSLTDLIGKVNNSIVTVDGLTQIPGLQYNVTSNSIVFSDSPVENSLIEVRLFEIVDANSVIEIREFVPGNSFFTLVYDEANNASNIANVAAAQVEQGFVQANAAFDQANTATDIGQNAFDQANTATDIGQNAFDQANTALITDFTDIALSVGTFGNTSFIPVIAVEANGRISNISTQATSIGVADESSDSSLNYPLFTTTTSGNITFSRINSTKLDYQPSTGRFRLLGNTASTSTTTGTLVVDGGVGVSGNVTTNGVAANNLTVFGTSLLGGKPTVQFDGVADLTNTSNMFEIIDNGATSTPSMAFHRPAAYATKITLFTDNALYFGGWSAPAGGQTIVTGFHNPGATNTYDLGTSTLRWRNIFTNDLNLNNGVGDWTIVEGEDDLFIYNNKKNKVYKFALIEVDSSEATPKIDKLQGN